MRSLPLCFSFGSGDISLRRLRAANSGATHTRGAVTVTGRGERAGGSGRRKESWWVQWCEHILCKKGAYGHRSAEVLGGSDQGWPNGRTSGGSGGQHSPAGELPVGVRACSREGTRPRSLHVPNCKAYQHVRLSLDPRRHVAGSARVHRERRNRRLTGVRAYGCEGTSGPGQSTPALRLEAAEGRRRRGRSRAYGQHARHGDAPRRGPKPGRPPAGPAWAAARPAWPGSQPGAGQPPGATGS